MKLVAICRPKDCSFFNSKPYFCLYTSSRPSQNDCFVGESVSRLKVRDHPFLSIISKGCLYSSSSMNWLCIILLLLLSMIVPSIFMLISLEASRSSGIFGGTWSLIFYTFFSMLDFSEEKEFFESFAIFNLLDEAKGSSFYSSLNISDKTIDYWFFWFS